MRTYSCFVLVHGGLHGAWCWEPILGPLRSAGHDVRTVELPGRDGVLPDGAGIDVYADAVGEIVESAAAPVVLVGHSLGGITVTSYAERHPDRIAKIILVNALLVEPGERPLPKLQSVGEECVLMRPGALRFSADGTAVSVDRADAIDAFYNRCDPVASAWAVARLGAEPIAPMMEELRISGHGFGSVPKLYIGSRNDRMLPWWLQQRMSQACGAELIELQGDHSPFLSVPNDLVRCLLGTELLGKTTSAL
jgi:pimeloyl-ACP methyl ester carboxylesterase